MQEDIWSEQRFDDVRRISKASEVPEEPHYAIFIFKTDLAIGSGYPVYTNTVDTFEYYVTTNKKSWTEMVRDFYSKSHLKKSIVALEVARRAKISDTIEVE